jgi:hypothetical protein
MSLFRNPLANSLVIASAALAMILSASACNSNDFAGGSGSRGSLALDGKGGKGGKDDANDEGNGTAEGKGTAEGESPEGKDPGGKEGDGIEGDEDSGDDTQGVESDDSKTEAGETDIGDDGAEVTKKTKSDLKIMQTREDDKHQIKVDLMVKGKVSKTQTIPSPGKNKEAILKDMCRVGLSTCLKVTFIGKITQVAGAASCVFTSPQDEKSVQIDVDVNGSGFLGSCQPGEDETFLFSCDESKSLKVQGCNS